MIRLYIVGSPESIHTDRGRRDFTKNDLTKNLNSLSAVRIFDTHTDASNYARSLRIAISRDFSYYSDSERTKLAPIIYVDVADTNEKYQFNKDIKIEKVQFIKYMGTYFNFSPEKSPQEVEIRFISLSKASFDMKEIKMIALEFADSGRPAQALDYSLKCRIL